MKMMSNVSQHFQVPSPALTWPPLALLHTLQAGWRTGGFQSLMSA